MIKKHKLIKKHKIKTIAIQNAILFVQNNNLKF